MKSSIFAYKNLIASFVEKRITAEQFEKEYLTLFKYDDSRSEKAYEVLNSLFWAVEDFCPHPELQEKGDVDESQLLKTAKITLEKINDFEVSDSKITNQIDIRQLSDNLLKELNKQLPVMLREAISEKLNEILPRMLKEVISEKLSEVSAFKS